MSEDDEVGLAVAVRLAVAAGLAASAGLEGPKARYVG
jgi:hypothetical protein